MTALRIRSEGTLRTRAARGDAAAFAAVYERHHQALYRYCRSILRHDEDAQDALQSTMTRAFAALQDEQRDFELRPWLFRIAHNEAISILRRRRETASWTTSPAPGELEDRVREREELRALQLDLADLPERQRAALVLRELNGLSHEEIGVVLELSPARSSRRSSTRAPRSSASARGVRWPATRSAACSPTATAASCAGAACAGTCAPARTAARFKADLEQRPKALRALAPPLPIGGAAALLAQLLGGGATAAKLLACVAIAGGGTTLAVEMQHAREPKPAAATPTPAPPKPRRGHGGDDRRARARRPRSPTAARAAPRSAARPRPARSPSGTPSVQPRARPRPADRQPRRRRRGQGASASTKAPGHKGDGKRRSRPVRPRQSRRRSRRKAAEGDRAGPVKKPQAKVPARPGQERRPTAGRPEGARQADK